MKFKLVESFLMEDIETVKKNYPQIKDEKFNELIKLDPTYIEGSNSLGNYGKWILNLYVKKAVKDEDLYKIPDLLKQFEEKKNWMTNKDIGQFKSLPELSKALDEVQVGNLTQRQLVRKNQNAKHRVDLGKDAELFYEDDEWEVWIPKTYAASCKLGSGTQWCTASTSDDEWYYHYRDIYGGYYFVFLNKNNPEEKYQLHLPSKQFRDKHDGSIWSNNDLPVMKLFTNIESKLENKDSSIKSLHDKYIEEVGDKGWVILTESCLSAVCGIDYEMISDFRWDEIWEDNITVFEKAKQIIEEYNENFSGDIGIYGLFGELDMVQNIEEQMSTYEDNALSSGGCCDTEEEAKRVLKYLQDGLLKLGFDKSEVNNEDSLCYQYIVDINDAKIHFEDYLKENNH